MATPRLPFLWPMLYKHTHVPRVRTPNPHKPPSPPTRAPRKSCRQFATTSRQSDAPPTQRYGKALEPAPHLRDPDAAKTTDVKSATASQAEKPPSEPEPAHDDHEDEEPPTPTTPPTTPPNRGASTATDIATPLLPPEPPRMSDPKPPDSVLHMPSPQDSEHHKPPHLKTPPYVHHFDTYGLVRDLHASSYTREQSTTLMKAVRGLLMSNMELARAGLVSKSNVENETYLFRAACSELKTEIGNARKGEIERMRAERAGLTHEVDILGQRLGQETGTLKDGLKGLFDDRKMGVRTEQRLMETKVRFVYP
jgi:hypothetical protein